MRYPFLGTSGRMYGQFLDSATGKTLQAEPGGVYDMVPAAGQEDMTVPPQDGLWGPALSAPKTAASKDKAAPKGRAANGAAAAAKGDVTGA